ncbi:DUF3306 domain-containing protein [Aquabacterium sp.]|uniref:DUF3306 domain-containing protein n=1 Tax=Aquabacterium sp. TaxID=1872578 RepID=UPI003783E049
MSEGDGFLSRWSQRKARAREGAALPAEPPPPPTVIAAPQPVPAPIQPAQGAPAAEPDNAASEPAPEPLPTLADVAALRPGDEVSRFVAPGVDAGVRNAALKKLFADPQFNVMDGLDTYIDDYGKPDPLPMAALASMVQRQFLGLITETPAPEATTDVPAPAVPEPLPTDEDARLRLQPHHAAGPPGPEPRAEPDARRAS